MAARRHIRDDEIKKALVDWGSISAAADALGIHRNSFYYRLRRLGLDQEPQRAALRGSPAAPGLRREEPPTMQRMHVVQGDAVHATHAAQEKRLVPAQQSTPATVTTGTPRPKLLGMQNAAAVEPEAPSEVRVRKPVRVKSEHQELLRQAKLDYAGKKRIETDESAILASLIERYLGVMLAEDFGGAEE